MTIRQGARGGHLRKYWLHYLALVVVAGVVTVIVNNVRTANADGRARDAAVAARAQDVSTWTKGGITVYDKSRAAYRWDEQHTTIGVLVRVGECDINGVFSSPVRPAGKNDISPLRISIPSANPKAASATMEVTEKTLPQLYGALQAGGLRHCVANDSRFYVGLGE